MAVKLVRLSTATSNRPDIEWLADGRILKGNTNLIYGDDGLCKSWVASSLCAAMSNPALGGRSILGEAVMHDAPGSMECIYMCGEDPYIADKLAKCGATDRVLLLGGDDGSGEYTDPYAVRIGDPDFAAMCAAHPGALIVLDPVKAYAPRGCKLNDGLSVQTGIHQPLRKLSIQHGITWLLICHTNKTGGSGRDKLSGSAELSNGSRSVLAVGPYSYDAEGNVETIWLGYTKQSILDSRGRHSDTVTFRLSEHGPELVGTIPYSAQQLQQQAAAAKVGNGDGVKEGSAKAAERDILAYLGRCGVPVAALEIKGHLEDELGYRNGMYHRAVRALVERKQIDRYPGDGNRWWLSLPEKDGGGKASPSLPSNSGTEAKNGARNDGS